MPWPKFNPDREFFFALTGQNININGNKGRQNCHSSIFIYSRFVDDVSFRFVYRFMGVKRNHQIDAIPYSACDVLVYDRFVLFVFPFSVYLFAFIHFIVYLCLMILNGFCFGCSGMIHIRCMFTFHMEKFDGTRLFTLWLNLSDRRDSQS